MQPEAQFQCSIIVRTTRRESSVEAMSSNDGKLAALLATNIDRHFKQLMLTYQHILYGFVLRQTGSVQEAEDITQETFIRSYYALKNYPAQKIHELKLQAWLFKIALNIFYNQKRGNTPQHTSLDNLEDGSLTELEDNTDGPDEIAWHSEQRQEVEKLVASLPERYRVVINLYYFEQLSYQEIAELLNSPLGTIKAKMHRGVALLRRMLQSKNSVR